jgi:hypothetical protein
VRCDLWCGDSGGAIFADYGAAARMTNSTLTSNTAGRSGALLKQHSEQKLVIEDFFENECI